MLYSEINEEALRFNTRYSANVMSNITRVSSGVLNLTDDSLSFSQIKLRYVILAKFEIPVSNFCKTKNRLRSYVISNAESIYNGAFLCRDLRVR